MLSDRQSVIDAGHPPVADKVALVDFDGTLFPFGGLMEGGEPKDPQAPRAVRLLKEAGYRIVIFTSRLSPTWWESERMHPRQAYYDQCGYIQAQCSKYDIPFDDITAEKVPAEVYFDDKAYRVTDEYPLSAAINDFLGIVPITFGFPASYGYGKRWHVAVEKSDLMSSGWTFTRDVALCQKDNYYALRLERLTETHVPPEPFCKHCARILAKEDASDAA